MEDKVLVTGKELEHLFGIRDYPKSTDEQMAELMAAFEMWIIWDTLQYNRIITFDAAASNTRLIQRACARFEREFRRTLL